MKVLVNSLCAHDESPYPLTPPILGHAPTPHPIASYSLAQCSKELHTTLSCHHSDFLINNPIYSIIPHYEPSVTPTEHTVGLSQGWVKSQNRSLLEQEGGIRIQASHVLGVLSIAQQERSELPDSPLRDGRPHAHLPVDRQVPLGQAEKA